jgi:hypothetical protein
MGLEMCEIFVVGNKHCAFSKWYGACIRGVNLEWWCNLVNIWAKEVARVFFRDRHEREGGGFHSQRHGEHHEL